MFRDDEDVQPLREGGKPLVGGWEPGDITGCKVLLE